MAYEVHGRLTFEGVRGTVVAPRERWAMRLNLDPIIPASSGKPTAANLNSLGTAWQTRLASFLVEDCRLTSVKWALIGTDGKYSGDPVLSSALDLPGSLSAPRYPDQISLVCSLNTAKRGPRGRGRVFLPGPGINLQADARIGATEAGNLAAAMASLLGDINNGWTDNGTVCVASSFGENYPVTSVRVGRAYDTVRSRRTSLIEGYTANVAVS